MAKIYKLDEIKKVVFLGTPEFAVRSFEKLAESKYKPLLVVTQPDKPKGRNRKLQATPVKISSQGYGVPVIQPLNINSEDVLQQISILSPDILVTVAYGGYLGKKLRKIAPLGCINLHPSLLPDLRGASPLQTSLFRNDKVSGLTIFKIVANMDAGPIINQREVEVPLNMNFTEYSDYMANLGADFLLETLQGIEREGYSLVKQNHTKATFTQKVDKDDLVINWDSEMKSIIGKIRGLSYQPGARTYRQGKALQILRAEKYAEESSKDTGLIIQVIKNQGFVVSCKNGQILVTEVKAEGKKAMSAHAYNLGANLRVNEKLG